MREGAEFHGILRIHHKCHVVLGVCVGVVVFLLAVRVTTVTKHIKYKALIETSTAVATMRVQLHSPFLMVSCQLHFELCNYCSAAMSWMQIVFSKRINKDSKRSHLKHPSVTHCNSNKCHMECTCTVSGLKVTVQDWAKSNVMLSRLPSHCLSQRWAISHLQTVWALL